MMRNFCVAMSALSMLCGISLNADEAKVISKIEDSTTRVEFPDKVVFDLNGKQIELQATGVATRTKFFVKVYSVAHYLENPTPGNANKIFEEIFDRNRVKQLTLAWVRGVESKRIQDGFQESFDKTLPRADHEKLSNEIREFIGFFDKDSKDNDRYVIRWLPEGKIVVEINGTKRGEVTNYDFAEATWGIWLGPKSIVNRNKLVSLIAGR